VSHLSEEDLVLHHFGEGEASVAEAHLADCAPCREALEALRRDLAATPMPEAPARGAEYGAQVWARLAPRLAARPRRPWARVAAPLAVAAALVIAFLLGRHWPQAAPAPAPVTASAAGRDRILLVAVGDHLERSEMLLVLLANAGDDGKTVDISAQQQWAEELAGANRLYRQTAARAGEPGTASVLDELERLLVDVAHRPSALRPAELADLRRRIESHGLLFRVRVVGTQLREKEKEATRAQGMGNRVVS
jgi:hypothetical protein